VHRSKGVLFVILTTQEGGSGDTNATLNVLRQNCGILDNGKVWRLPARLVCGSTVQTPYPSNNMYTADRWNPTDIQTQMQMDEAAQQQQPAPAASE